MLQTLTHVSLRPRNTFGMEAFAEYYSELNREEELRSLKDNPAYGAGLFVLGGGSNILLTGDVPHWVLHNKIGGIDLLQEDDEYVWLWAGAGAVWHSFVLYCVERGYAGVENLSLIPGTVGAAPIQNIGAYGVEAKDVIEEVRFFDLEQQTFRNFTQADCRFGYRDSIFKGTLKGRAVITSVVFRLNKIPRFHTSYGNIRQELDVMGVTELSIKHISDAVIRIRSAKLPDPEKIGNAGSFFKNPEVPNARYEQLKAQYPTIPGFPLEGDHTKIPAGWMIEQCGWKGYREDDYGVHKDQALVLVNYGNAKGADIATLSVKIMDSVKHRFGIQLEREVQII
ncbi:UDP-N-acetylmuramate dehydrogenase [Taibaiella koreensis]|uniref:UDP-N-acetylmuramate dehydrogenase n=1 Tax=Taibaiella koreensis TaxID=1268548 RepID=UPI000E59DAF7|nr:UDP-N-acetylmuramate dehydrogenase [Taibaiella koreensis]